MSTSQTAGGRGADTQQRPHDEAQGNGLAGRLNWLRAGVLGANDGIVSVAGIVVGVAGATRTLSTILVAGIAGLVAGAMSMAVGEYVSVSSQRDTEQAMLAMERHELAAMPEQELVELTEIYQGKGLSRELATRVAQELTAHDALRAHAEAELGIDPSALTSPLQASAASLVSFTVGALLPLLAIALPPPAVRLPVTFLAVVLALVVTGLISARLGRSGLTRAVLRNVLGGAAAMAVTYLIGSLVGVHV